MTFIMRIMLEIFDLFVDDGTLALLLILWTVQVGLSLWAFDDMVAVGAPVLVTGYVVILIENVYRFARRKRRENEETDDA